MAYSTLSKNGAMATMELKETKKNWEILGKNDPFYGVLSDPDKKGGKWDEKEFYATGRAQIEKLKEEAKSLGILFPAGKAMDFGCGVGRLSHALANYFDSVTGVDIAQAMLDLAKKHDRSSGKCEFMLNDRGDLSVFPTSSYDLIFTDMVLQHIDKKYALNYIREFVRVIKKGGLAVFQYPEKPQYSPVRLFLKRLVPGFALTIYRRIRYGPSHNAELEVEMTGAPKQEIIEVVTGAGGNVLNCDARYYWVTK